MLQLSQAVVLAVEEHSGSPVRSILLGLAVFAALVALLLITLTFKRD